MPNHVKNRVKFNCSKNVMNEIFEKYNTHHKKELNLSYDGEVICKDKNGDVGWYNRETGVFSQRGKEDIKGMPESFEYEYNPAFDHFPDFNKIVPYPEGFIETIENGDLMTLSDPFSSHDSFKGILNRLKDSQDNKRLENFINGIKNYFNHGYATWYSWQCDNWGTKWNCYECEKLDNFTYSFDTAWSNVLNLILKISEQFPEILINYDYSDEDTGFNCGKYEIKNGKVINGSELKNESIEAYNLAFELRPDYKKCYKLENNKYVCIDE